MNHLYRFKLILAGASLLVFCVVLAKPGLSEDTDLLAHPDKMPSTPLEITFPAQDRRMLSCGMAVYLRPTREIPLIEIQARVRTGSYLVPNEKLGLADLTGAVMRTGGTLSQSGPEIDEALEFVGASVETGSSMESGGASLSCLVRDLEATLGIFSEVLRTPRFDLQEVEVRRGRLLEAIRRRNDQPGAIVAREFNRLIYGDDHPFGRLSTAATLGSVHREDLMEFHKENFYPNNIILAVSGDFEPDDMMKKLESVFLDWEPHATPQPDPPEVKARFDHRIHLIDKAVAQSNIRMGHLSIRMDDPDYVPLMVVDEILGAGGFSSRLMREVRSKRGLAYSVGSSISAGRIRGTMLAYAQTKPESTAETIKVMLEVIKGARKDPFTEKELARAKEAILNRFVFWFTSAAQVVRQQANLEFNGLPPEWLESYRDRVASVSLADLSRVAQVHLHPDQMTIVVVGPAEVVAKPLDELGIPIVDRPLEDFSK